MDSPPVRPRVRADEGAIDHDTTTRRPIVDPDGIPSGMRTRRRWICWKVVARDGKPTKVPCTPEGGPLKWADPNVWLSFGEALAAYRDNPQLAGIGIVLGDGLCGFDSDDCIDNDGAIEPETVAILERLGTYFETSPSGRGVKAFLRGPETLPDGKRGRNEPGDPTEWYTGGRWFAVTGLRPEGAPGEVAEAGDAFATAYRARYLAETVERRVKSGRDNQQPSANGAGRYAVSALAEELAAVEGTAEGARNSRLNSAAFSLGQLVGAGLLDRKQVADALLDSAERCGLGRTEAERTIESGLGAGIAEPRDLSDVRSLRNPNPRLLANGKPPTGSGVEAEPGGRPEFANHRVLPPEKEGGKPVRLAIDQPDLIANLSDLTGGWPRRAGGVLFAHDGGDAEPVEFTGADQLLAWVGSRARVVWADGASFVSQRRFFEALRQTVTRYDAIERHPHFPAVPGVYYACPAVARVGDGSTLERLLDLFRPATEVDRELIRAFALTLFWGGPPGKRPMFLAEGPENDPLGGRGVGKSDLFSILAGLVGGTVSNISVRDDVSAITKRVINDKARKRCVLLDNVKVERFSWGDLEGLITGPTVGGWLNYIGDEVRPNLLTYCMTLNGASMSEDLAQRTVMIRLRRPESYDHGGEAWSDMAARFVAENRAAIIADVAGTFSGPAAEIRSHQRWASWTHAVLARCNEPHAIQNRILERQDGINDDRATANEFTRFLGAKLKGRFGRPPEDLVVWVSTDALVPIVAEFTGDRITLQNVSKRIGRFRPRELTKSDRKLARGWQWAGGGVDPDNIGPDDRLEWIHPSEVPGAGDGSCRW